MIKEDIHRLRGIYYSIMDLEESDFSLKMSKEQINYILGNIEKMGKYIELREKEAV